MLRTIDVVQKNLFPVPCDVITVPANTSAQIFPLGSPSDEEYAFISLFNDTGAKLYYAFGQTCDNVSNYNGVLADQSSLPVLHNGIVNVYSVAGGKVATTVFLRKGL
jgi:hypothetical protein